MNASRPVRAVRAAIREYLDADPFQKAAALSYYTLLSMAPLLLVVIGTTGLIVGREAVRGQLVEQIRGLTGEEGARAVQTIVRNIDGPGGNAVSLTVGVAALLVGATTVFAQLQKSLNQTWGVGGRSERGFVWSYVRRRLLSLAMVLVIGFLLMVSLVVDATLVTIQTHFQSLIPGAPALWQLGNIVASILVVSVLIMVIYRFLSDVRFPWRNLWLGGFVTAVLFSGGKYLLGLYVGRAAVASAYGAAGSLVVLLIWVYYASLIFFAGAVVAAVATRGTAKSPED